MGFRQHDRPNYTSATPTYTSADQTTSLTTGQFVKVLTGLGAGNIYQYLGPNLFDGNSGLAGIQAIDLSTQNYQNTSLWKQLVSPTTLTAGQRVKIANGALAGDVYEYVGTTLTDGDPNTAGTQAIDLASQNFQDRSA